MSNKPGMRQRIRDLEAEIKYMRRVFGAAVIDAGGELRISFVTIESIGPKDKFSVRQDLVSMDYVFTTRKDA